jgi:hypothetical protein
MAFVAGTQYGAGTQLYQCINQTKHNDCATCYAEYQEQQQLLDNKKPRGVCAAANQNTRGFTFFPNQIFPKREIHLRRKTGIGLIVATFKIFF